MMGYSNASENERLRQYQLETSYRLLPDVICLSILCVIGTFGNILAAVFYVKKFKRTTTLTLIIVLTLNDILVCTLFIPNIIEMKLNVNNSYRLLCKVTHFLNQWFVGTSCILLLIISIDRYRRICKPFGKQIPTNALKYIIPFSTFFSLCTAVRKLVSYDTIGNRNATNNRNFTWIYCTNTNDPTLQVFVSSFYTLDSIILIAIWIIIIVAYSKSIHTLMKQKQKKNLASNKFLHLRTISRGLGITGSGGNNNANEGNAINGCAQQIYGMNFSDDQSSYISDGNDGESKTASTDTAIHQTCTSKTPGRTGDFTDITIPKLKEKDKRKGRNRPISKNVSGLERNLTFMMFTATAVFLLSFTPFFTIKLMMRKYIDDAVEYELRTGIQFMLKLPLVNSVFTPIIYCIFISKFRQFLKPKFRLF